jgi:hypothetical protein
MRSGAFHLLVFAALPAAPRALRDEAAVTVVTANQK